MENRFFDLLPSYLKTPVNKKTSALSADVMFEPEDAEQILGQVGDVSSVSQQDLDRVPQIYESDPERRRHQLSVAAAIGDGAIDALGFVSDLVGNVSSNGAVGDQSRLFDTGHRAWTPPFDVDRWTNFHRYVWIGPGAARTNAEYITKDPEGSRVVFHRVDGASSFAPVLCEVSSVGVGSFAAGSVVGQLREDGTTADRIVYRWTGSAWNQLSWTPVDELPTTTTSPIGTHLYVARVGHLYQRPMVSFYSPTARRWIARAVCVGMQPPPEPSDGMVWEDCASSPKRRLLRYSSGAGNWTSVGAVPTATLVGLGLRSSPDVVYHAFSSASVTDGWKSNNWWFHFDDLSSIDRASIARESFGVRPILQFWGGIETYAGDSRANRHDEPRFNVYAYKRAANAVVKIDAANFGDNSIDGDLGSRIVSFKRGVGRDDAIMGFPLSLNNTAEVVFECNIDSDVIESEIEVEGYRFFRDVQTSQLRTTWTRSDSKIVHEPDGDGVFGIPRALVNNPDHGEIATFTRSDVLHHMVAGISASDGDPCGSNGSRWSPISIEKSLEIIDPDASPLKAMALAANGDTDLAEAIRTMASESSRFYRRFVSKLEALWNTGDVCDPSGSLTVAASVACDLVLTAALAARVDGSPFWTSGMGTYTDADTSEVKPIGCPPSPARVGAVPATVPGLRNGRLVGHMGNSIQSFADDRDLVWLELEGRFYAQVPSEFKTETSTASSLTTAPWNLFAEVGSWTESTNVGEVGSIADDVFDLAPQPDGSRVFSRDHGAFADRVDGDWVLTQSVAGDVFVNLDDGQRYTFNGLSVNSIRRYPRPYQHDYTWEELSQMAAREFERWCLARGKSPATNAEFSPSDRFTWNYSSAGIEGGWRGIYRRIYGTWNPHSAPWECCGYSIEPSWWRSTFVPSSTAPDGTPRYASSHAMWSEIRSGLPSAPLRPPVWGRCSTSVPTPVDGAGELLDPISLGVVDLSAVVQARASDGFRFGDLGTVEEEFWTAPEGRFALAIVSYLCRPSRFVGALWNDSTVSIAGVLDAPMIVDSGTLKRPTVASANGHGAGDSNPSILGWIAEAIMLRGSSPDDVLFDRIRTVRPVSAWRAGGYLSRDRLQASLVSGIPVPAEDAQVIVHRSAPVKTLFHGGAIIQKSGSTYRLYGYDWSEPSFAANLGARPSIGGFVVLTQDFASDGTGELSITEFSVGTNETTRLSVIVDGYRIDDSRVTVTPPNKIVVDPAPRVGAVVSVKLEAPQGQEITRERFFETSNGRRFGWLPTWSGETAKYGYGHPFQDAQEVVDFLVDHGRYQESVGWRYDDVESGSTNDWVAVARRFAEWASVGPADGEIFADVAGGRYLRLELEHGSVMDMTSISGGANPASDIGGYPIVAPELNVSRIAEVTEITSSDREVFSVRARVTVTEHAVAFSNTTRFNDLVYNPVFGLRHPRLVVSGLRTKSWRGRLEAPGYVISGDVLLPNLEKMASDASHVYDRTRPSDSEVVRRLAFGLYGWWPRPHVERLGVLPATSFDFHRQMVRKKGTVESLKAYLAGTSSGLSATSISENWTWRVADIGALNRRFGVRFLVDEVDVRDKLQIVRFADAVSASDSAIEVLNREDDDRWVMPPEGGNASFPADFGIDRDVRSYSLNHLDDVGNVVRRFWHWDPAAGLHEPRARAMVDIVSATDPARYTSGSAGGRAPKRTWGRERVGTIWWDTSNLSYSDYRNKNPLRVRADEWGSLDSNAVVAQQVGEGTITVTTASPHGFSVGRRVIFNGESGSAYEAVVYSVSDADTFEAVVRIGGNPQIGVLDGYDVPSFKSVTTSDVEVYEWVESSVPPAEHPSNDGRARNASSPSWTEALVDGSIRYFYWVRWRDVPTGNRTSSALSIESALRDPTRYGGGWFSPISEDSFVFDASGDRFEVGHTLEVKIDPVGARVHTEWTLVREGHEVSAIPDVVVEKVIDSLIGIDANGGVVPSPWLIGDEVYGVDRGKTVFRDRAAARRAFVDGLNRVASSRQLVSRVGFSEVFPLADEGTWWSRATWVDAELDGIDVVQSVKTISDRDLVRLPMDGDWVRVTEATTDPILGTPHKASATFRREAGAWVQHGASSSTVSVDAGRLFALSDVREKLVSVLDFMDPADSSAVVFSALYEMLSQGRCPWFYKTSLIDVSHGISISNPSYRPIDEVPLVESAIAELKPFHTKVRDLKIVASSLPDENENLVADSDVKRVVEFVDRLSSNLGDEWGFDSAPFDAVPFDLQPLWMLDNGLAEWADVASFEISLGQSIYYLDVRPPADVELRIVAIGSIPAAHEIARERDGRVRVSFESPPPVGPTYVLQHARAFSSEWPSWPLDPEFDDLDRTLDHAAYRLNPYVTGFHNTRSVVGSPHAQASSEDGGDLEERCRGEAPDRAAIDVTTDHTPAYFGFDSFPFDGIGFDGGWTVPQTEFTLVVGSEPPAESGSTELLETSTFVAATSATARSRSVSVEQKYEIGKILADTAYGIYELELGADYELSSAYSASLLPPREVTTFDPETVFEVGFPIGSVRKGSTPLVEGVDYDLEDSGTTVALYSQNSGDEPLTFSCIDFAELGTNLILVHSAARVGDCAISRRVENLCARSSLISHASWTKTSVSIGSSYDVGPASHRFESPAATVTDSNGSVTGSVSRTFVAPQGEPVFARVIVAKGSHPRLALEVQLAGGAGAISKIVADPSTGSIESVNCSGVASSLGSYWSFDMTMKSGDDADTNGTVAFYPAYRTTPGTAPDPAATGTQVLWGIQVSTGKYGVPAYVETVASPVSSTATCRISELPGKRVGFPDLQAGQVFGLYRPKAHDFNVSPNGVVPVNGTTKIDDVAASRATYHSGGISPVQDGFVLIDASDDTVYERSGGSWVAIAQAVSGRKYLSRREQLVWTKSGSWSSSPLFTADYPGSPALSLRNGDGFDASAGLGLGSGLLLDRTNQVMSALPPLPFSLGTLVAWWGSRTMRSEDSSSRISSVSDPISGADLSSSDQNSRPVLSISGDDWSTSGIDFADSSPNRLYSASSDLDDVWSSGAHAIFVVTVGASTGSPQTIAEKSGSGGWSLKTGTNGRDLVFRADFSGSDGTWTAPLALAIGQLAVVQVSYDSGSLSAPTISIDGAQATLVATAPTGSYVGDAPSDFAIGAGVGLVEPLSGKIHEIVFASAQSPEDVAGAWSVMSERWS